MEKEHETLSRTGRLWRPSEVRKSESTPNISPGSLERGPFSGPSQGSQLRNLSPKIGGTSTHSSSLKSNRDVPVTFPHHPAWGHITWGHPAWAPLTGPSAPFLVSILYHNPSTHPSSRVPALRSHLQPPLPQPPSAQRVPPRVLCDRGPCRALCLGGCRPRRGRAGPGVLAWGSRTKLLPSAGGQAATADSVLARGWGQQADNGPHSLASWPWPLELGRQLLAEAAASAGPSRSPRLA